MTYWKDLVDQRDSWIEHNFPRQTPTDTILGVIEEYGELTHSYLKMKQEIRGTPEQHTEDMKDAIGDLTVYLLGVMSYADVLPTNIIPFMHFVDPDEIIFTMSRPISMISYFKFQHPVKSPVEDLLALMKEFCRHFEWDYEAIVEDTWHGVSQRDWIAFPGDGKTH